MGGMGGIAKQDQSVVMPAFADDPSKFEPCPPNPEVRCIGQKRRSAQIFREQLFADLDRLRLIHLVEAKASPGLLGAFHNEGRAVVGEAIGVSPDPTGVGLFKGEGKSIKRLGSAKPDETIGSLLNVHAEVVGIGIPEPAGCRRRQ